ncbi:MAG: hypothetical protein EHM13_05095, partial [Acidobacteria bacterium]
MKRPLAILSAAAAVLACYGLSIDAAEPRGSGIDLTAFDRSVRPQDDLFLHVNGAWLARTPIPPDKGSYGTFEALFDKSQEDLRAIVEEAGRSGAKPGSDAQKIGDFYASFMDEQRAEALGVEPIEAELAAIDALRTRRDLARQFARMFKLNLINPLVGFVEGDAKDPRTDTLYVYQGGLGLPDRDYYTKDDEKFREYRDKYVGFLETLLKLSGQPASGAPAEILAIETELAKAHWTNVENRDVQKTYNKYDV